MPITQQDIAKHAKVSRSLVGQVLSERPGTWVSHDTKQRILRTARELNYQPNASARMLRHGKSGTVGMFGVQSADEERRDYQGTLMTSVCAHVLAAAGFDLKLKVFSSTEALLAGLKEAACGGLCDAFIASGDQAQQQGELLEMLGVRFAVYGDFEQSHPHWFQVDFDHEAMMSMAVRSLSERGKVRPAMLCYVGSNDYNDRLIGGYRSACAVHYGADPNSDMILRIGNDNNTERQIVAQFDRWMVMPQSQRPDSIVMGVETPGLVSVEESIWRHGMLVGFAPDQFGLSGACFAAKDWLRGDFSTFDWLDGSAVARLLTEDIIVPLLHGKEVAKPILRVVPDMHDHIGRSSKGLQYLAAILAN